ncbi:MAG: hypothetical protein HYS89_00970 [Candidatus Colwellbacteria bacterium]|nr:hypothetical protein [Candidatus Colwellbacteria bacterium]
MSKGSKIVLLILVVFILAAVAGLGIYIKTKKEAVTLFGLTDHPAIEEITVILKGKVIENTTGKLVVEADGERLVVQTDSGTYLFKPSDTAPITAFNPEEVMVGAVVRVVGEVEGGAIKANTIIREEDLAVSPIGPSPDAR